MVCSGGCSGKVPRGAEEDEAPPALLAWFGERISGSLNAFLTSLFFFYFGY